MRLSCSCAMRLGFSIIPLVAATVGAQPPVYLTQWGTSGIANGQFETPEGVATDAAGNVYVADTYGHRIQKFTSTGGYITKWGTHGSANGQFENPVGGATDAAGEG